MMEPSLNSELLKQEVAIYLVKLKGNEYLSTNDEDERRERATYYQ